MFERGQAKLGLNLSFNLTTCFLFVCVFVFFFQLYLGPVLAAGVSSAQEACALCLALALLNIVLLYFVYVASF